VFGGTTSEQDANTDFVSHSLFLSFFPAKLSLAEQQGGITQIYGELGCSRPVWDEDSSG
jgi:hypothetical protein